MNRLPRMLLIALSIYAAYLLFIVLVQDRLLFPRFLVNGRASGFPARFERIALDRGDFTVEGRFLPAGETTGPAPTVVLLHGNAMLAEDWVAWADELSARGWNVLLPEFRGYADSGGRPTRAGLVEDAAEFVRRVRADPRVDAARVALYGRSIGGMVAAEAAVLLAEEGAPPSAVVLHTTPSRIADFAWRHGAPPFLVRQRFDAVAALSDLRTIAPSTPITIIAHRDDEIVSRRQTLRLSAAAGIDPVEVAGTHNGFASARDELTALGAIERGLGMSVDGEPGAP